MRQFLEADAWNNDAAASIKIATEPAKARKTLEGAVLKGKKMAA